MNVDLLLILVMKLSEWFVVDDDDGCVVVAHLFG